MALGDVGQHFFYLSFLASDFHLTFPNSLLCLILFFWPNPKGHLTHRERNHPPAKHHKLQCHSFQTNMSASFIVDWLKASSSSYLFPSHTDLPAPPAPGSYPPSPFTLPFLLCFSFSTLNPQIHVQINLHFWISVSLPSKLGNQNLNPFFYCFGFIEEITVIDYLDKLDKINHASFISIFQSIRFWRSCRGSRWLYYKECT